MAARPPTWVGWLAIALAIYPILIALGVLEVDPGSVHAPMWVLGLVGFVCLVAGAMVLLGHHNRLNDAFASLVLFAMAACGAWVAIYAPADGFSGGFPFLSHESNVKIGRVLFGGGAVLTVALGIYAAKRAVRRTV